ncbi:hypothetical protein BDA99DRAFT_531267 [Phascolomyces articulosus]|uniref:Uncharacterized protein n=1 Tax=Phascolomyces articulosus TaxID=60185 RepID=A0AAD5PKE9_9FUNG|nr:hypothetical protein BDA99DRAFT_531267 [Phascolomyces articulosus]
MTLVALESYHTAIVMLVIKDIYNTTHALDICRCLSIYQVIIWLFRPGRVSYIQDDQIGRSNVSLIGERIHPNQDRDVFYILYDPIFGKIYFMILTTGLISTHFGCHVWHSACFYFTMAVMVYYGKMETIIITFTAVNYNVYEIRDRKCN